MSHITSTVNTGLFTAGYMKFGNGSRNMVILPGLSVKSVLPYAGAVEKQYEIFSQKYTVYLIERRNELPCSYPVNCMVDDTAEVMRALGIEKADIFGASQGGMIALSLAAEYPGSVNKIAVASTSVRVDEKRFDAIDEWITLACERKAKELYLSFACKVYPPELFIQNREAFIALSETVSEAELDRFITLAEGTRGFDITAQAKKIKCPVFCAFDKNDDVLGAEAGYEISDLFAECSGFEASVTEGFGHAVYDTAPDFALNIYKFFEK